MGEVYDNMVDEAFDRELALAVKRTQHARRATNVALVTYGEWMANDPSPPVETLRSYARYEAAELAENAVRDWRKQYAALDASATVKTVHLIEGAEASGLNA